MQLCQLDPSHAEAYQTIRLQALRESPTAFNSSYEEAKVQPLTAFAESLRPNSSRFIFGLFDAAQLVATAGIGRDHRYKVMHKGSLNGMYVAQSHRRQGLGKQLLIHVLRFADCEARLRQLTLVVNATNTSAISLYKVFGFKSFGIEPCAALINGVFHDQMHMVRITSHITSQDIVRDGTESIR